MRSLRGRLTITIVALVVLTAAVLGVGAYAFVDLSLHDQLKRDALAQAGFDLSETIPGRLADVSQAGWDASRLADTFEARGIEAVTEFGDQPSELRRALSPAFQAIVDGGSLGFEWTTLGGNPSLVVGGRLPGRDAAFLFVHDAASIEAALGQLRTALGVGALVLAAVALVAARRVARGVLQPVQAASRAAERIERGDLSARVPVASRDELGGWAQRFNRMADSLQDTIGRLEAAQQQNRRFVSDVSHELRTPLTALVAEASILREHLGALPPEARRTGELLVEDVTRLRTLVEDLMELSRYDAAAEQVAVEPVDLRDLVRRVAASRHPEARVVVPDAPLVVTTDPRRVERILGNLLDNTREHAAGAPVQVRLREIDGAAILTVADAGPGVPEDRIGRIFERFFKADPSRHGGSSGLGLAIAAENAALIGGRLRARNRPDGGLWIGLRLPVTERLRGGDRPATARTDRGTPSPTQEPIR